MAVEPSDLILVAFFAGMGSEIGKEFWAWFKKKLIKPSMNMIRENGIG